ncbi:iron-containing alcohol dehydrogenase [Peptacetobacter sp.]|uniref:iron-containing alcohol dehydrogenase n=1 Tax=Peptacetobacter sp. TaxID=2991975 RepID=UPI00263308E8|nr:iron-containing alcohol dehydrogenase [Peptacetobacter sp.]
MEFNYNLPVNIIFGRGKVNELGKRSIKYGNKALVVTGKNSSKKSGLLDKSIKLLEKEGIETIIFDKVTKNPLISTVEEGATIIKSEKCDMVVAIGGGSIMDAAKAIAFIAVNEGNIKDYMYGEKESDKALPIILVPTTSGTGSEGNCYSVLTDETNNDKKSLRTPAIYAKESIVDPELMITMPKKVKSAVIFDAAAHAMEAAVSKKRNPLSDMYSLYAMKLIADNAENAVNDENIDYDIWEKITLGSTLAGMAIGCSSCALPHALEHPASGLKDIVHGEGLAAITPTIIELSWESDPERYAAISALLGGNSALDCADRVRDFLKRIDLDVTLKDLGIEEKDVDWMVENAFKVSAGNIANHPKKFSKEEIKEIYLKSL